MVKTMVIKVQYRDMLRRFSAEVDENDELVLDMDGLRAKIFSFFGFSPDADLTLTYIDEDGDKVTLVDDGDLRDMMKQEPNFVKIDVVLNSDKVDDNDKFPRGIDLSSGSVGELSELVEGVSKLVEYVSKAAGVPGASGASCSRILFGQLVGDLLLKEPGSGSRSQRQDGGSSSHNVPPKGQ